MRARLALFGADAHHTTSPSASMMYAGWLPPTPPLVMMKPRSCAAAFIAVRVMRGTFEGTAPVVSVYS
jgi:hypothetical protein